MTPDKSTAQDDLAFIKRLMSSDDGSWTRTFGRHYALWGGAFIAPLFLEAARMMGWIALPGWFWPAASAVVVLFVISVSFLWARGSAPPVGMQAKSANAIFGGVGWANVAVLIGLIFAAVTLQDGRIMMIHAVVVFAFQGAAWYAVWALRRVGWTGAVAGGWFVAAVACAAAIGKPPLFILAVAASMILLMVIPGLYMTRGAKA